MPSDRLASSNPLPPAAQAESRFEQLQGQLDSLAAAGLAAGVADAPDAD
jgi:hypothetical protein